VSEKDLLLEDAMGQAGKLWPQVVTRVTPCRMALVRMRVGTTRCRGQFPFSYNRAVSRDLH
jgi:hypothetical protein